MEFQTTYLPKRIKEYIIQRGNDFLHTQIGKLNNFYIVLDANAAQYINQTLAPMQQQTGQ